MAIVSQALAQGQPAPGFAQIPLSGLLGLTNVGLIAATATLRPNTTVMVPTGGTLTLPAPKGSGAYIVVSTFGTGVTTLSGIISAGGSILSSFVMVGDQTLVICDADATRGWV